MSRHFLVFTLAASLGAMGELAGAERRGSLLWPARSAIIGLMGAALGIRRDGDFSELDALQVSVGIYDTGTLMRDFHTAQSVPGAAVKNPNSRPEALRTADAADRLVTSISTRDYQTGVCYSVAVEGPALVLVMIRQALRNPAYTLYLGRKSCPLSFSPASHIVAAESVDEALLHAVVPPWHRVNVPHLVVDQSGEGEAHIVHDVPIDRQRHHHAARTVWVRPLAIDPEPASEAS